MGVDDLYSEYILLRDEPSPTLAAFFQKNALVLSNVKSFESVDVLERYTRLMTSYMNNLLDSGMYNQAADYGEIYKQNVNDFILENCLDYFESEGYRCAQHLFGIACYRLRDYKNSLNIFQTLSKQVPENDSYRIWLESARVYNRLCLSHFVQFVSIASLVLILFLKDSIKNFN